MDVLGTIFDRSKQGTSNKFRSLSNGLTHKTFFKVLSDRSFFPYLDKKECPYIEEAYLIRVDFDNGDPAQVWTFDDLAWWARDRKLPRLYSEVLAIALDLEADRS